MATASARGRGGPILPRHSPCLEAADLLALGRGLLAPGSCPPSLEELFAPWLPDRRLVATPTGRHALWLFLEHAGLRPGDEVAVAAYNFHVVVRLLLQKGLTPLFVDVEPDTLCMDPAALEASLGPRTRMVLLTHMFGHPAPVEAIRDLCQARGLLLFEDCAHAVGSRCGPTGAMAGSFGDGALFSFGIFKIVNALGGGMLALPRRDGLPVPERPWPRPGALTGAREPLERLASSLLLHPRAYTALLDPLLRRAPALVARLHPSDPDPDYRFDPGDRQLFERPLRSLCQRQLARLEPGIARRRGIVARIHAALEGREDLRPLTPDHHGRSNGSYLPLWCIDPQAAARWLAARGVDASAREFTDCAGLEGFAAWRRDCPVAAEAHRHTLRVPSFPCLRDDQVDRIVRALEGWRP